MNERMLAFVEKQLNRWRGNTLVVTSLGSISFLAAGQREEIKGFVRQDGALVFWRRDLNDVYPNNRGNWDNKRVWI